MERNIHHGCTRSFFLLVCLIMSVIFIIADGSSYNSFSNFSWPVEDQYGSPPLEFGFYSQTCPQLEEIVRRVVSADTTKFPTTPAKLLRLFFHDCFVQGCDASVLLDSNNSTVAEKNAENNFSLGRYITIDSIKQQVEVECPGIVSCADILALSAVYSIAQADGPLYPIELGRRDSLTSYAQSAKIYLPGATLNISGLIQNFQNVGLDKTDVVALSGAHTIGQGHCSSIADRLYPKLDPSLKPSFGQQLLTFCSNQGASPPPHFESTVQFFMDPFTPLVFDNQYFKNIQNDYGLFTSDKALLSDPTTAQMVREYAQDEWVFFEQFGRSLRKMGKINVLTGTKGQIRKNCRVRNSGNADPALDASNIK